MGIVSKGLAALVVLGIGWMLISAYGSMKFDAGWQAATTEQRAAADKIAKDAADEKAAAARRLAALQTDLDATMDRLNRLKIEKLHADETYARWRSTSLHPVARCRIYGMCDK